MKKLILLIIFLLGFGVYQGYAQGYRKINDKHKRNQIESEVYRWKHTPKWWYTLFYYRYKKHRKNNVVPLISSNNINKKTLEENIKEKNQIDTMFNIATKEYLDRKIDIVYMLDKDEIKEIEKEIKQTISEMNTQGVHSEQFDKELKRIFYDIKTVREAHLENAKRRELYKIYYKQLEELNGCAKDYLNLQIILGNYEK